MRERYHLPDTEPLPRQDAPKWAYALADWCERRQRVLGELLVSFCVGLTLGFVGIWLLGGIPS